jgi:cytochrome c biogenesis protein ResB
VKLTADYSVFIHASSVLEHFNIIIPPEVSGSWWFFPLMILCLAAFVATILFITVQVSRHLRVKHRQERLEKLKQSREAYRKSLRALYSDIPK